MYWVYISSECDPLYLGASRSSEVSLSSSRQTYHTSLACEIYTSLLCILILLQSLGTDSYIWDAAFPGIAQKFSQAKPHGAVKVQW